MVWVYVSVGSNIAPAENIRTAIGKLRAYFQDLIVSSVYESEAIGFKGDNFYNLAIAFHTDKSVYQVANILREIEDQQSRDRSGPKFSSRTIDLDLLLYDDLVLNNEDLNVPRDEISRNAFVLWPLAEIAADVVHPLIGRSFGDMWHDYEKESQSLWPIKFDWRDS